jgi:hypothetical protein
MVNPKDTAAELAQQLQAALEKFSMPQARRRDLEELAGTAADLAHRLEFFHNEYVLLDLGDTHNVFEDAYREWEALAPGNVDKSALERIVGLSQPLGRLHRAGIDITGMKKFNSVETSFALTLGKNFADIGRAWDGLKKSIGKPSPDLRFQRQYLPSARLLIDALDAVGIFSLVEFAYLKPGAAGPGAENPNEWVSIEDVNAIPKRASTRHGSYAQS